MRVVLQTAAKDPVASRYCLADQVHQRFRVFLKLLGQYVAHVCVLP